MRVGFDAAPLAMNAAGERRSASGLLGALARLGEIELVPLTLAWRRPRSSLQRIAYQALAEGVYYPLLIGRRARRARVELVYHPRHLVPPEVGLGVPSVVMVHDALPLTQPEHFTRLIAERYKLLTRAAVKRATLVVTPSCATRADVVALFGVDPEKVEVVPHGVEERFRPSDPDPHELARRFGIERPYVLCVATLEPRKNLVGAVRAFELVARDFPDHALVVAGGGGWKRSALADAVAASDARIVMTGYLEDEDLVDLYSGARCFLYPSFGEGFGFPVLEAMACGTPVVASNRPSIPEVAGEAAVLVDPAFPAQIAAALADVLGSPERRAELARRGLERSGAFSWERSARLAVRSFCKAIARGDAARG